MSIVLMGSRCSGKTTVGRKLADRLWYKFVDVDDRIVELAGKSIARIFAEDGEPHFRDLETQVVRELSGLDEHVIGLGGGTLIREENRTLLKDPGKHRFVYLRCDPEELLRRMDADPRSAATRPVLTALGGGLAEIEHLIAVREPVYRQMADAELDVTHLSPDDAVARVVRMI